MALIKCPECGKEISDTVSACPNCGLEMTQDKKKEGARLKEKEDNKANIGLCALVFSVFIPIVGFILAIVGIVKNQRYSILALLLSIIMPIFYCMIFINYLGVFDMGNLYGM